MNIRRGLRRSTRVYAGTRISPRYLLTVNSLGALIIYTCVHNIDRRRYDVVSRSRSIAFDRGPQAMSR